MVRHTKVPLLFFPMVDLGSLYMTSLFHLTLPIPKSPTSSVLKEVQRPFGPIGSKCVSITARYVTFSWDLQTYSSYLTLWLALDCLKLYGGEPGPLTTACQQRASIT